MRLHIDFSVFLPNSSAGVVTGAIECSALPRIGETVSFLHPKQGVLPPAVHGFNGLLKVEAVIHTPNSRDELVSLALESVTLESVADIRVLVRFLEQGFELYFNSHDPAGL